MQNLNKDLYQNLREDSIEIRNCITNYIKYIIATTTFTGFFSYIIDYEKSTLAKLYLIIFVLFAITFLFEIIWYKFKSHNRFVGYMQLLAQEQDYIEMKNISPYQFQNKSYIKKYKKFIGKTKINEEDPKKSDYSSWDYMMSRLNDDYFKNNKIEDEVIKLDKVISSTNKSKFIFSVSDKHYKQIKVDKYDKKFFESIIWTLYGKNLRHDFLTRLLYGFKLLYVRDYTYPRTYFSLDQRYVSFGWKYPRKVTQIAFLAITLLIFIFFHFTFYDYGITINFNNEIDFHILGLIISVVSISFWWLYMYISKIDEIVYGKHSIDGYCWHFFPYRVQYLNNIYNYIPVYFSRNFIRFFKTNVYIRTLSNNNNPHKRIKEIINYTISENLSYVNNLFNKLLKTNKNYSKNEIEEKLNNELIKTYFDKLKSYNEFLVTERIIHKIIVMNINSELKIK